MDKDKIFEWADTLVRATATGGLFYMEAYSVTVFVVMFNIIYFLKEAQKS